MHHRIQTRNPIAASAYLPIVTACRLEGTRRYCTTAEGSLTETITRSDDATRTFAYAIDEQDVFPVDNIRGEMRVVAVPTGGSVLEWDVEFDAPDPEVAQRVEAGVRELYGHGAAGLERLALAETADWRRNAKPTSVPPPASAIAMLRCARPSR